jgi:hypothetical protein
MRPAPLLFGYALAVAWWAPAILAALVAAAVAWRYGRGVQRAQRRTHAHTPKPRASPGAGWRA